MTEPSEPMILMVKTQERPKSECPTCGVVLDAVTGISPDGFIDPKPGDLTLCSKCGTFLTFGPAPELRHQIATYQEVEEVDETLRRVAEGLARYWKRKRER